MLWLLDGALQFQPFMYRHDFVVKVLAPNAAGQPAPVADSIRWASDLVSGHLGVWKTLSPSFSS